MPAAHLFHLLAGSDWRKPGCDSSFLLTPIEGVAAEGEAGPSRFLRIGVLWVALLAPLASMGGVADGDQVIRFDISRQRADQALIEFAEQADVTFIFPVEKAREVTANEVKGEYTPREAIRKLLLGTGLRPDFQPDGALAVSANNSVNEQGETVKKRGILAGIIAAFLGAPAVDAGADQALETDTAPTAQAELAEIIVTARKREERFLDVPLSLSVLSSKDIDLRALVGMGDYLNSVPGVTMQDRGAGRSSVIIRGITVDQELEAVGSGGSAVGIYFGEIPLAGYSTNSNSDIKLVDMERVEVLRGPQGTLYGSSALAGAVRTIPNAPDLQELEGNVKAGYSTTEGASRGNYLAQGVLNFPLVTGRLAARVVGFRHENGGFIDNVAGSDPRSNAIAAAAGLPNLAVNEKNVGDDTFTGGRLSVLWEPTDAFQAQLTYMAQKLEQDGFPEVQLNRSDRFEQTRLDLSDFVSGGERLEHEVEMSNLVLTYDFGWGSLQSSSSQLNIDYVENRDIRTLFPAGTILGDTPFPQTNPEENEFFSQELRFVSSFDGSVQLIAGVYYEDVDLLRLQNTFVGADPASNPFGDPNFLLFSLETDLQQLTFFGELSYSWNDRFKLTLGGRYFDYSRDDVDTRGGLFGGGGPPSLLTIDEQSETFKVNFSYTPTESAHVYAQWAEGFRLGRGNLPIPASICDIDGDGVIDGTTLTLEQVRTIRSDTLDNYELGGKFAWLDNRATTNFALFSTKWNGLPQVFLPPCGIGAAVNSGTARVQGVELEATLRFTNTVRMNLGASYKNGELREVLQGVPAAKGDRLPGSADLNLTAGIQVDFQVFGYDAFVRGDYTYVGGYFNNLQETGVESGKYHLGNIRFGMAINRLDLGFFVDNVANADETLFTSLLFAQDQLGVRLRPRTFGVDAQYRF